jgi:hypothetical protein
MCDYYCNINVNGNQKVTDFWRNYLAQLAKQGEVVADPINLPGIVWPNKALPTTGLGITQLLVSYVNVKSLSLSYYETPFEPIVAYWYAQLAKIDKHVMVTVDWQDDGGDTDLGKYAIFAWDDQIMVRHAKANLEDYDYSPRADSDHPKHDDWLEELDVVKYQRQELAFLAASNNAIGKFPTKPAHWPKMLATLSGCV